MFATSLLVGAAASVVERARPGTRLPLVPGCYCFSCYLWRLAEKIHLISIG